MDNEIVAISLCLLFVGITIFLNTIYEVYNIQENRNRAIINKIGLVCMLAGVLLPIGYALCSRYYGLFVKEGLNEKEAIIAIVACIVAVFILFGVVILISYLMDKVVIKMKSHFSKEKLHNPNK